MISDKDKSNMNQFYRAVLALENEEECRKFFDDVATIKELLDLSEEETLALMVRNCEPIQISI